MQFTGNIRRMCVLAGLTVMAALASAAEIPLDAQIRIDRALNSPTLTIRYDGANAAIVELRINGQSIGTRSVSAAKASGETNFDIDLTLLKDGDNEVEVRLFDRTGKLVGSDKTNISTDMSNQGPVFLKTPKVGESVQGTVEINLGFGRDMRNVYASFFVNNDFKKMMNYPPYTFMWDTTMEANGWHEVEVWVIDESSTTFKTRKTRVFVNNPGGRTDRVGVASGGEVKKNEIKGGVVGTEVGLKSLEVKTGGEAADVKTSVSAPGVSGSVTTNRVKANPTNTQSGAKPLGSPAVLATGSKSLTPTGKIQVKPVEPQKNSQSVKPANVVAEKPVVVAKNDKVGAITSAVNHVAAASTTVKITKGQRVPNLGSFAVVLNSQYVNFDVNPRVDEGVPMTPFRHLLEKAGGTVGWENLSKTVTANAEGKDIIIQIGDAVAVIDKLSVSMERAPYLERGRTIVPLSFLRDVLNVDIEFDKETGHVLITSIKK